MRGVGDQLLLHPGARRLVPCAHHRIVLRSNRVEEGARHQPVRRRELQVELLSIECPHEQSVRRRRISRPSLQPDGTRHRDIGMQQRAPPDDVVGVPARSGGSCSIRKLRQFRIELFSRTKRNTRFVRERPSRGAGQHLQSMQVRGGIRNPPEPRDDERWAARGRQQREILRELN